MPYRYAIKRQNYGDYASGRVFYGLPGQPAFPIRLASEILQRCIAVHHAGGRQGPYVLHDPLCGGAYLLATLAYLHGDELAQLIGSDVDAQALSLANRNLALLTVAGIDQRLAEIKRMLEAYGKDSHRAALGSAQRLKKHLLALIAGHVIETRTFQADATENRALERGLGGTAVDIVLTDVPYGQESTWRTSLGASPDRPPLWQMLQALSTVLSTETVVAIAADKGQRIVHEGYTRIERFRLGKRQVALLQPAR